MILTTAPMKYRRDGYDALTEESAAALRRLQERVLGAQEQAIYDALLEAGTATRYELAEATGLSLLSVTRRTAGMRTQGIIRQLPSSCNKVGPSGIANTVVAVVPKFLKAAHDRRFKEEFAEFAHLTAQHKAKLAEAWELKDEAMQVLKRIHKKLRRMRKPGRYDGNKAAPHVDAIRAAYHPCTGHTPRADAHGVW